MTCRYLDRYLDRYLLKEEKIWKVLNRLLNRVVLPILTQFPQFDRLNEFLVEVATSDSPSSSLVSSPRSDGGGVGPIVVTSFVGDKDLPVQEMLVTE